MKVVNIGNIAEAYICDELPAMGVVIEAALDELERLPNLTYKEVTISATPRRNCERFASAEEAWNAYDEWVESYRAQGKTEPFNEFGWLFAPATEKEGANE